MSSSVRILQLAKSSVCYSHVCILVIGTPLACQIKTFFFFLSSSSSEEEQKAKKTRIRFLPYI